MDAEYHAEMSESTQPTNTDAATAADDVSSADDATSAHSVTGDTAFDPPPSIAPVAQLSTRGFFIALALVCLIPLTILSGYAVLFGKATEKKLPVSVNIDRRPVQIQDHSPQTPDVDPPVLEDVIVVENDADFAISNIYVDLNGQFFMYVDQPLAAGDNLVLPQTGFVNRTGQRWVPGNFRVDEITVMGKLPSGARGVTEFHY